MDLVGATHVRIEKARRDLDMASEHEAKLREVREKQKEVLDDVEPKQKARGEQDS